MNRLNTSYEILCDINPKQADELPAELVNHEFASCDLRQNLQGTTKLNVLYRMSWSSSLHRKMQAWRGFCMIVPPFGRNWSHNIWNNGSRSLFAVMGSLFTSQGARSANPAKSHFELELQLRLDVLGTEHAFPLFSMFFGSKIHKGLWKKEGGVFMFIHVVSSSTPFQTFSTLTHNSKSPDTQEHDPESQMHVPYHGCWCHNETCFTWSLYRISRWAIVIEKHGNTAKIKHMNIVTSSTCEHVAIWAVAELWEFAFFGSQESVEARILVTLSVRQVLYSAGGWQKHPETEGVFLASGRCSI